VGNRQLFSVDPDGLNVVQLTASGDNTAPAFSPAGTKIAFQSTRAVSKGIDVWVGNWTATPVPALGTFVNLSNANGNDTTPSWSPTPTGKIVFASDRNNGQNEIYVMSAANGSAQTRFTNDPKTDQQPAWAPSPTPLIAFSSDRAGGVGGFDIHVMGSANGKLQVRLGPIPGADTEPYWLDPIRLVFAGASFGGGGLVILPSNRILPARIPNTLPGDKNPG
jgi:Tol biopolymer transport system component